MAKHFQYILDFGHMLKDKAQNNTGITNQSDNNQEEYKHDKQKMHNKRLKKTKGRKHP